MKTDDNNNTSIKDQWISRKNQEEEEKDTPHRLTLLVGFWTRRVPDKMKNRRLYGPCGPLPPRPSQNDEEEQQHTWVEEIHKPYDSNPKLEEPSTGISSVEVPVVTPAWETLKPKAVNEDNNGSSLLEIPQGIDHRFFVRDAPKCFRDCLFERDEEDEEYQNGGCCAGEEKGCCG